MKVMVVLAHPHDKSFNHAIAERIVKTLEMNGKEVIFHDLYKEEFNPVIPYNEIVKNGYIDEEILRFCNELISASGLIFIHPNWWGQPPAILKGWIDRVFRQGISYQFKENDSGEGIPIGLLKNKKAVVFNTADTSDQREKDFFGDPLDNIWKKCIFEFNGIINYYRKTFNIIVTSTGEMREKWLEEVEEVTRTFFLL